MRSCLALHRSLMKMVHLERQLSVWNDGPRVKDNARCLSICLGRAEVMFGSQLSSWPVGVVEFTVEGAAASLVFASR
ncbi:hypothetical protein C2845_PM12G22530 [Panicum miliaceum]|uniref:Uncharacterized protein n=1 Tax=Panicum miliaceum TaxID=4540 RepID=A0A3L6QFG5_PANMI|nr:hypothetical protein C2845_PM12G22530 [Panicum miliaceum]